MKTQVQPEYRVLQKGDMVNGHKVLRRERHTEYVEGSTYASWIALLENTDKRAYHRYVTWLVIAGPEGFFAESGNYFAYDEYEKAYGNYEYRTGW